jgi:hypothetical protein
MTMIWVARHPKATPEMLGYLPDMISDEDPRPAREQFDANYRQGGGWSPFPGFTLMPDDTLEYPGDPPVKCWQKPNYGRRESSFTSSPGWL